MKRVLLLFVVCFLFLQAGCSATISEIQENISQDVIEILESYGMTGSDADVRYDGQYEGYRIFYFDIKCDNIDILSYDQMFDLDTELNKIRYPKAALIPKRYISDGTDWEISRTTRRIYKNGELVYDDYYNSESYESFQSTSKKNSYTGSYDATLSLTGEDSVLVFATESALERFIDALVNEREGTIEEMLAGTETGFTEKHTKCNIVEKKYSRVKVKLLDGDYAGNTVWTIIESLHETPKR